MTVLKKISPNTEKDLHLFNTFWQTNYKTGDVVTQYDEIDSHLSNYTTLGQAIFTFNIKQKGKIFLVNVNQPE